MTPDDRSPHPNHLIIVCGHAIWTGGPTNGIDESEWIVEDWKKGETPTYTAHIKAGLKALAEDERALLVFSGGPTVSSTTESEAQSYANLAHANNYWDLLPSTPPTRQPTNQHTLPQPPTPTAAHPRILIEPRALDSYQNILLSLLTFWRATARAHWPTHLTIVSHAFKRRRLAEIHTAPAALGFVPRHRVAFVGVNPPGVPAVLASEERAAEAWVRDPHGRSEELRAKRRGRNPHGVGQLLFEGQEERRAAGLRTVVSGDGREEFLVDEDVRPWALQDDQDRDDVDRFDTTALS